MDGENNGKTCLKWDDLGVYIPIFGFTPIYHSHGWPGGFGCFLQDVLLIPSAFSMPTGEAQLGDEL